MMKARYVICAEIVMKDSETNKMSAVNIFDAIQAVSFPIVLRELNVLLMLNREEKGDEIRKAEIRLSLNEKEIIKTDLDVEFTGDGSVNRTIVRLMGILVHEPGKLKIELFEDSNSLGACDIDIRSETTVKKA